MPKVLLVDDLEPNLEMLKSLLEGNSFTAIEAHNGAQALEQARLDPPDIIVSDILMPVMDGFALCHDWMLDPVLSKIPFVFSTATYTEPRDEALGLSLGAARFIIKPIDPDSFIATIREVLAQSARGALQTAVPPISDEVVYYRLYNEALIRKLEAKMLKLEALNKVLDQDIAERRLAQNEIKKLNDELERRVASRTLQLENARKEMEAFSYSVSHDLRAPLRAIDGFSKILAEHSKDRLDDEGNRYLGKIGSATRKMDNLITSLLDLSRVGAVPLSISTVDMRSLADTAYREVMEGNGSGFVAEIGNLPGTTGDLTLLHQVWFNLISNAIKFSRNSEMRKIEIGGYVEDGENIYFVKDFGVGFDPEYADRLFGIFQRLHSPRDFEGTGIGLALVRRIVSYHRGRVWAESVPDRGATFYFSIPIAGEEL